MCLVIIGVAAAIVFIYELRLLAFPRFVRRSERIRIRLSSLRHKVVMYASSERMSREDRKSVVFLYKGATLPLRCPFLYPAVSSLVFASLIDDSLLTPPKVKRSDFSEATQPLLTEFAEISEDLVNQFAHPAISLLAALSGKTVIDFAREAGSILRDAKREREAMRLWQKQASAVAV